MPVGPTRAKAVYGFATPSSNTLEHSSCGAKPHQKCFSTSPYTYGTTLKRNHKARSTTYVAKPLTKVQLYKEAVAKSLTAR